MAEIASHIYVYNPILHYNTTITLHNNVRFLCCCFSFFFHSIFSLANFFCLGARLEILTIIHRSMLNESKQLKHLGPVFCMLVSRNYNIIHTIPLHQSMIVDPETKKNSELLLYRLLCIHWFSFIVYLFLSSLKQ